MTEVVEVDTRTFLAHYIPSLHRIEISKYAHEYPYLYEVALQHELGHSQRSGWQNFTYELREYWKQATDKEWQKAVKAFKKPLRSKFTEEFPYLCLQIILPWYSVILMFGRLYAVLKH